MAIDDTRYDGEDMLEQAGDAGDGELELGDGAEALPWLESDEDFEEDGVDTGRIVAFVLIGLVVLGLIVGGIWWVTRDRSDSALVPDGSTVASPEGPYKTRPDDPGGKTFAGTGDSSFAVAEGQSREGQLAADEAPKPSLDVATASKPAAPVPASSSAAPASGGVGVQVGAYSSRESAEAGWSKLVSQLPPLQGARHRVIEGQADIGKVYRLQAVAADVASAGALCGRIKAAGGSCQVKP